MENKPLVSILMNCYNGEKYLKEAIDSIYAQTYDNWEIIFVDNCSTDKSAEIAKSYSDGRLKYYKTEKNVSLGAARNWGLQYVKGHFLAFLDTDDIWLSTKLDIQINLMLSDNSWMSFSSSNFINNDGKIIDTKILPNDGNKLSSQLIKYSINMQTVVINLNKVRVDFDEALAYAPDYKLFMNILIQSNEAVSLSKEILVMYRVHKNSLSFQSRNIKYDEVKSILLELKKIYPYKITKVDKEFKYAYKLNKVNQAEYFLSENKFYSAAKIYFEIKDIRIDMLIKSLIYFIPGLNKLFYQLVLYKREKYLMSL